MCTALIRGGKRYIAPSNGELDPVKIYFIITDFVIMKTSNSPLLKNTLKNNSPLTSLYVMVTVDFRTKSALRASFSSPNIVIATQNILYQGLLKKKF